MPFDSLPTETEPKEIELTFEMFVSWLRLHWRWNIVGWRKDPLSCPVANWIKFEIGGDIGVYKNGIEGAGIGRVESPWWVRALVTAVDMTETSEISRQRIEHILSQYMGEPDRSDFIRIGR